MKQVAFSKYAWFTLAVNILVILWGAFVRATGSGAGCGSHWPLCNGQVIPREPQVETVVEFVHRATSGLALILVLILLIWAFRSFPKAHPVRNAAMFSAIFILLEAIVGAGLVRFGWVADDESIERMIIIAVHLVNTFILLASLALTAWWGGGGEKMVVRGHGLYIWLFILAIAGLFLIGITGAITALGDTLFPAASLSEGFTRDFLPTAHFLERLRIWHPVVAISVGFYLTILSSKLFRFTSNPQTRRLAGILISFFVLQLLAGAVNLVLLAPVWMQIVHLLLADLVWVCLIILTAVRFTETEDRLNSQELVIAPSTTRGNAA